MYHAMACLTVPKLSYLGEHSVDGTYTRMLRAVLGVSWKEHKTNKELYGNLPKITDTLMIRRRGL